MKAWLKYLIPYLVIAAFFAAADNYDAASEDYAACDIPVGTVESSAVLASAESSLSLPYRISVSGASVVHGSARRVETHRHASDFVRSGRLINVGAAFSALRRNPVISSTSVTEHTNKLVWIGKLTI